MMVADAMMGPAMQCLDDGRPGQCQLCPKDGSLAGCALVLCCPQQRWRETGGTWTVPAGIPDGLRSQEHTGRYRRE